jgi:hypothetical protein
MAVKSVIDMRGAIDLHLHAAPSLFPRVATDREVAEAAARAGFAAIVLKSHHESTVARADALDEAFDSLRVFGGIVLNSYVGGVDPSSVEAALVAGAKQVWLPTIDAAYHALVHGGTGSFDAQVGTEVRREPEGISLLWNEELRPEVESVLKMIAKHDAILGTAHQSFEELRVVIPRAHELGVSRILLTHPFFKAPGLSLQQTEALVALGAVAEFTYCTVSARWAYARVEDVAEAIKTLGAGNCILTSDGGQVDNPLPPEGLRIFAHSLVDAGVNAEEIDIMIRRNPARLLDLGDD